MRSTTSITTDFSRSSTLAWWQDEAAVAAIEYGLLAALIAIAAIGGFTALGGSVENLFIYWAEKVLEALQKVP